MCGISPTRPSVTRVSAPLASVSPSCRWRPIPSTSHTPQVLLSVPTTPDRFHKYALYAGGTIIMIEMSNWPLFLFPFILRFPLFLPFCIFSGFYFPSINVFPFLCIHIPPGYLLNTFHFKICHSLCDIIYSRTREKIWPKNLGIWS